MGYPTVDFKKSIISREYRDNHVTHINANSLLQTTKNFIASGGTNIVVDIETTGLDAWSGKTYWYDDYTSTVPSITECEGAKAFKVGIGLLDEDGELTIGTMFIKHPDWDALFDVINSVKIKKIGHNIKFDIQVLHCQGYSLMPDYEDTLIMSRLLLGGLSSYSLKNVGLNMDGFNEDEIKTNNWGAELTKDLTKKKNAYTRAGWVKGTANYSFVQRDILDHYLREDILHTAFIYLLFADDAHTKVGDAYSLEMATLMSALQIERRGIYIDMLQVQVEINECETQEQLLTEKIQAIASEHGMENFKVRSHLERKLLLNKIGISAVDSTDKEHLISMKIAHPHELFDLILQYRFHSQLRGTFLENFRDRSDEQGRLHCQFKVGDTRTGRLSCIQPNLQNIPRTSTTLDDVELESPVRKCVIGRPGFEYLHFDYSQVEMRVFAYFCQERSMLETLSNGGDLHSLTAEMVFGDSEKQSRQRAKAINFGIIYGMGVRTLSNRLLVPESEGRKIKSKYYETFPGIPQLQDELRRECYRKGYIEDPVGRRYYLTMDKIYKAVNAKVQGFSSGILKRAVVKTDAYFTRLKNTGIINLIHDEIVVERPVTSVDERMAVVLRVVKLMESSMQGIPRELLYPKVEVEIEDGNWSNKVKIEL